MTRIGILVLAALFAIGPAWAINEVKIVQIADSVETKSGSEPWKEAKVGDILRQGHEISVDPDGSATLAFADNSTVVLRSNTQVKIGEFFTEGGVVKTEILLKLGDMAAKVHKNASTKSDFRIRSPTATASVRGTELHSVTYTPVQGMRVYIVEGFANVGNALATAQIEAGDTTRTNSQGGVSSRVDVVRENHGSNAYASGITPEEQQFLTLRPEPVPGGTSTSGSSRPQDIGNVAAQTFEVEVDAIANFNNGTLNGFTGTNALVVNNLGSIQSPDMSQFAVIHTGGPTQNLGAIAATTRLLAPITAEISFDHNFLTTEEPGAFFSNNDQFRVTLTSGAQSLTILNQSVVSEAANLRPFDPSTLPRGVLDLPDGGPPDVAYQTGFRRFVGQFAVPAGMTTLSFAVIDAEDAILESAAAIDNVRIRALQNSDMNSTAATSNPALMNVMQQGIR